MAVAMDWAERVRRGASSAQLCVSFEAAIAALWRRAHQTVGDVTLAAIASRVVNSAAERQPAFAELLVDGTGVRAPARALDGLQPEQLAEQLAALLADFLAVLGRLTAEILTPALHAELAKVAAAHATGPDEPPALDGTVPGPPERHGSQGKDVE